MKPIILVILGAGIVMHLVHHNDHTHNTAIRMEGKTQPQQPPLTEMINDSATRVSEATLSIPQLP
ncbi:hypothetical protein I5907_20940 [Panacibacter sp. DH6]|uniref:Uncharacterized protein n=1 Tax=Panacibacter microcysteis TaxID=2793269 RepID=A0A931MDJ4_9BACT|nr:hypothetical protein [Panacibacter microcysteis]MBG9378711.1 hypothetical protein [Panacibacter microcysteis]